MLNIFSGCNNIVKVTVRSKTPITINSGTFPNAANATLYVPIGCKAVYEVADEWKKFKTIVELAENTDVTQLENAIYIEPLSAKSGNKVSIDIKLKNSSDIAAYSFNLVLPEGVTLEKNAKGKIIYALAEDRHDEHSGTFNEKEGNIYSVAVLSVSGGEVSGNDGTIITLQAVMNESMEEGDYPILIQNAMYSLPDGQTINVPETQTVLTIENTLVGDVNDNGDIDIGDAVCIVNYIVGKPNAVFVEKAADVNGNGTAGEIGDAVSVVNIIVGKTTVQTQAQAPRTNRTNMLDPQ